MKKSNDQTLGQAIRELIEAYNLEGKLDEVKLIASWEKVTGKVIVKHTKDIFIKNRKLYIRLDSPALKHELLYARGRVLEALNNEAGKQVIDEVVFI
jgi:predicted nucleic acid-binding Zn ribbon protein